MRMTRNKFRVEMEVTILIVLGIFTTASKGDYDLTNKNLFPPLPHAAPRSKNEICRDESRLYISNLNNLTLWAHKMWDASAKSATGVLQGNLYQMGDWDECMKVEGPFKTQFCLVTMTAKVPTPNPTRDPFSIRFHPNENVLRRMYKNVDKSQISRHINHFGWCVPSSCTTQELEQSLTRYFDNVDNPFNHSNVSYSISINPDLCQTEKDINSFAVEDIIFCLLVAVLFVICIVSTVYDFRSTYSSDEKIKVRKASLPTKMFLAFSLRSNFASLPNADDSNPALSILYGLRTFSIFMIIMDHRFGTFITGPVMNYDFIEGEYRSISTWFIFHGDLFVDTFFVLSGLLVTYCLLCQLDKKFINPGFIILLRYIRLTPLYAFVIFYYASMYTHTGNGPIWKFVIPPESIDCKRNWWANILYLSNYVNDDKMCMAHTWYLPCDFHYFIIAIFIVILLKRNKKMGLALMGALFVVAVAVPFIITVVYLRPALLHFYTDFLLSPKTHTDFRMTYTKSHTRAAPYIIGMFAGYIFYKLKDDKEFAIQKTKSHLITLVSILLLFGGMASGAVFYNPYHEYNAVEAAVYAAFHRSAWALGTVGLIFAASYGHATFLKMVLSWSPWVPLSKLVYGAYLVHMSFQIRYVGTSKTPRYFDYFDIVGLALGDIVLSFVVALIMYLGVETPFRKIFKELMTPPQRNNDKEEKIRNNNNNREFVPKETVDNGHPCVSHL